jgi:hypothetical protein
MRIFQEGDRLLNKHFGVFLLAILFYIFLASLIKVLYMQFYFGGMLCQRRELGPKRRASCSLR